jgi:outer membrane protein, multidrug efflux system
VYIKRVMLTVAGGAMLAACSSVAKLSDPFEAGQAPRSLEESAVTDVVPSRFVAREIAGTQSRDWLADFNDPQLSALMAEAFEKNFNLAATAERLVQAEALLRSSRSGLFPNLDLGFDARRTTSVFEAAGNPSTITSENLGIAVSSSWEADVWGRVRDGVRASQLEARATAADVEAFKLSLAGQVAQAWFEVIETSDLAALSVREIDTLEGSLRLTQRRYDAGLVSALDVRLARSALASAQATQARRGAAHASAKRRLEVLLGRYPGAELAAADGIAALPALQGIGTPFELLVRRPDLIAAEAQLEAAGLRADVARKAMLPRLSLAGSLGTGDDAFANLFDPDYLASSLLGDLTLPLFRAGALRAEKARQESIARTQLYSYAQAVLTAFSETETAIQNDVALGEEEAARRVALEEADAAERLAERNYREAGASIFNLLDAQRQRINAEAALIGVRAERANNRVRLHIAIAGPFTVPGQQDTL